MIRPATAADVAALQAIERAAGEAFRAIGMPEIADDEPLPADVLAGYIDARRAWVAADNGTQATADNGTQAATDNGTQATADMPPVAYLIADVVDGNLHIEQVSVHPDAARRGIGRALIEHAATYARAHGLAALTLTTFTDVPWNAPYYERCGFKILKDHEVTGELRAVVDNEIRHGLHRWPRVAMRR